MNAILIRVQLLHNIIYANFLFLNLFFFSRHIFVKMKLKKEFVKSNTKTAASKYKQMGQNYGIWRRQVNQ